MFNFFKGKMNSKTLTEQPKGKLGEAFTETASYSRVPIMSQQDVVDQFHSSPFLHLCVDKIAKTVATNDWKLYRLNKKGDKTLVRKHPLLTLIERPNVFMTQYDFFYSLQALIDLHGNAYIMYEREKDMKIKALWLITPSMVTDKPRRDNGYRYKVILNAQSFTVPITEMLHIKELNMKNPYGDGVGTGCVVSENARIVGNARKQVDSFFYNGMTPEGIVGIEGLDGDELFEFKEKWIAEQQGVINAYKMQFLNTTDFKYQATKQNFKDSQVLEITKEQQETIRVAFGISPEVLGIVESSNRATAMTAKELYLSEVIEPRLAKLMQTLNVSLVTEYDGTLKLAYQLKSDAKTDRMLALIELVPQAFQYNEIRELAGLEPDSTKDNKYVGEGGESNEATDNSTENE